MFVYSGKDGGLNRMHLRCFIGKQFKRGLPFVPGTSAGQAELAGMV